MAKKKSPARTRAKKKKTGTEIGEPVPGFPIRFEWQTNAWLELFDAQVELIRDDIDRARADDRAVIYLSCPISNRGGGYSGTNVEIAKHTQSRLLSELGGGFGCSTQHSTKWNQKKVWGSSTVMPVVLEFRVGHLPRCLTRRVVTT